MKTVVLVLAAALLPAVTVQGQEKKPLAFEVASIKPNTPDGSGNIMVGIAPQPGGRLTVTNANLRMLIRFAYNIDDAQISGGPPWMDSDRYDIVAKGEGNATTDQLREMTQTLLADRFGLKIHRDSKELPVYNLVVAKGGPKLKQAEVDSSGAANPAGVRGGPVRGGMRMVIGGTTQMSGTMSMAQLSTGLANMVGRKVIDKTGLSGNYEVKLEWTPQPGELALRGLPAGAGAPGGGDRGGPPPADANSISIFTAVQEQLGLRLDAQKGPVDVIVVDGATKPSVNP
jgi:uncharacterized protein (TIGR03435 family)